MELTHYYDLEATSMTPHAESGFTFRVTRIHQFSNLSMSVGETEIYTAESCPGLSPYTLTHPDLLTLEDFLFDIGVVPRFIPSVISVIGSAIPKEFTSPARALPRNFFSYFNMSVTLYFFSMEKDCSALDQHNSSPPFDVGTGGDPCSICLEDIHANPQIMLPCSHVFHITCIVRWLCSGSVTCPLCRHTVDVLT